MGITPSNITTPEESTVSSFATFRQNFSPSVRIDDGYLELYTDSGFSLEIDETALAMLAYAVRPEGFVDSKGRQLDVTIADQPKKKQHLGRHRPREHRIEVFRNGNFNDEQRKIDLRFAAKYGYASSVLSSFEISEMNSTLLHELSHAADSIEKTRAEKLFGNKAIYGYAGLAIYGVTYYYGKDAISTMFEAIASNYDYDLQDSNTLELISIIGSVSLAALLGLKLQSEFIKIGYETDPGELKAYGSEKLAHILPKPIVVTKS